MRKSVLTVMTPRRLNALEPTLRAYAENLVLGFRVPDWVQAAGNVAFAADAEAAADLVVRDRADPAHEDHDGGPAGLG